MGESAADHFANFLTVDHFLITRLKGNNIDAHGPLTVIQIVVINVIRPTFGKSSIDHKKEDYLVNLLFNICQQEICVIAHCSLFSSAG